MKKTAFIQAAIIVILLSVSWILLIKRLKKPDTNELAPESTVAVEETPALEPVDPAIPEPTVGRNPVAAMQNEQSIPPAWTEWIDFLQNQQSAEDLRLALFALRDTIFAMDPTEAQTRLIELISSGVNISTGLRFQPGRDGNLLGAPDLQTMLIDWLGQLDPVQAASLAKSSLASTGEAMGPDAYVMHLRNYARGTTDVPGLRDQFVRAYFNRLIMNPQWTDNPVHSIAESMDFAVYLADGALVAPLSHLMSAGQDPGLRHASSMAIERLVILDPIGAGTAIIDSINQSSMPDRARAGYMARLDPANPTEYNLLTKYLRHPAVSRQEAISFLQYFPNLNMAFSHNLVSRQISITEMGDHMLRLRSAVNAVHDWQSNPLRPDIQDALSETEQRLMSQIQGEPLP